jgi:agmatine deiminase
VSELGTPSPGTTPRALGYAMPAEWAPHRACWLAWPFDGELWEDGLLPAQQAWLDLAAGIADVATPEGARREEALEVLVPTAHLEACRAALASRGLHARLHELPYGDIWMRDTAPLFLTGEAGVLAASFTFNGWGGRYLLAADPEVSQAVAGWSGHPTLRSELVLEGGSVEVDGEGTCLTTRQCLLNPNRNPGLDQATIEAALREWLGVDRVIWLGDGLLNDHTDGHIDTVARFVAPGVVIAMHPAGPDDPNREALEQLLTDLRAATDARGRPLEVVTVPSPGAVLDEDGELLAASYVNFYIANGTVCVPVYDLPADEVVLSTLQSLFPTRRIVPVPARTILTGGGAMHCITQQEPSR